jgi:transcriptional regulator with GAF, ATPase, and Fis domain
VLVARVAPRDVTVLLAGESGTGKERVAEAIVRASRRADRPFVRFNCAALAPELAEAELFGHARGAFTGAVRARPGLFREADGGTLLLDEVGELAPSAQAKLLRVLQEREFERVGGTHSLRVDVRVIAATNRDLQAQVAAGAFRADLYYRLNVFPIHVPALRERREDIPLLLRHFADKAARKLGRALDGIAPEFIERARAHGWPGNIRELENLVERAAIMSCGPVLDGRGLFADETRSGTAAPAQTASGNLEQVERAHIFRVLESTRWVIEGERGAARVLGLNASTLRGRLRKLGIRKSS